MIPAFDQPPGAPYGILPPGVHWADLIEIERRFAINPRRRWLFEGIESVVAALRTAGCRTVYLNGSYVTSKPDPGDFDGCWEPNGVDAAKLDPVLLDFRNKRAAQKAKYRGEMFIATSPSGTHSTFVDFFQVEKSTGLPKGIIGITLLKANQP